jgi:CRP/FNR family transcriptional regulator, cyclic AMP receptor protein
MRARFESDKRLLVSALSTQEAVVGDTTAAELLADSATIVEYTSGEPLVLQGGTDNDVFFILSGSVSIQVHGREVARRCAGQHIGEMALINPNARRSASVIAIDAVTAAKLSEANFETIAAARPQLWRSFARQLCNRLAERNKFVRIPNDRPALFLGCATESLSFAEQVQLAFKFDPVDVRVWTDDVFGASSFPLVDLETAIERSDFGVLLLSPDDEVTSRMKTMNAPRDNVIFELGLFIGGLGHARTFLVKPRGVDLKIPSDLLGLTPFEYTPGAPIAAKLLRTEIWNVMEKLGVR